MRSNLNLGVRHILPLYPIIFLAVGCAAAWLWRRHGTSANVRTVLYGLAAALVIETGAAYPDYLAFFNRASGGERGGIRLLGDSNLDWGQDLPALAAWQKNHPDRKLYLLYFGVANPEHYGIKATPLPGSLPRSATDPPPHFPHEPAVMAISASHLQTMTLPPEVKDFYTALRENGKVLDVLGGSIYLYEYPQ